MPRQYDPTIKAATESFAYDLFDMPNNSSMIQQDACIDFQKHDLPQAFNYSVYDEQFKNSFQNKHDFEPNRTSPVPLNPSNLAFNFGQTIQQPKQIPIPLLLMAPKQKRQKFTPEEDEIIVSLVGDNQFPNWNEIASHIKGKTGRQCRERFQHYLSPKLSRDPWTPQEDQLIMRLYNQYGPNWALIAEHFNGKRTNNNIKNRFNNHIKFFKNLVTNKSDKRSNGNYKINQIPQIAYSPQPQVVQPIQLPQTLIQFNNFNVNENINDKMQAMVSFSDQEPSQNSITGKENDNSPLMNEDDFNEFDINEINIEHPVYVADGSLESDICCFDQNMENFDCFSDFLNFDLD